MGREVRRVPADWQHPKNEEGDYIPLHDGADDVAKLQADWDEQARMWDRGFHRDYKSKEWQPKPVDYEGSYEEWAGWRPDAANYMPNWPESERTHLQMYEDTTEGTPLSPVMATPEELARWLDENGASAFADQTATYDQWLSTIRRGWACSAISKGGGPIQSGVEGLAPERSGPPSNN